MSTAQDDLSLASETARIANIAIDHFKAENARLRAALRNVLDHFKLSNDYRPDAHVVRDARKLLD